MEVRGMLLIWMCWWEIDGVLLRWGGRITRNGAVRELTQLDQLVMFLESS
jgi:hypothetical protein